MKKTKKLKPFIAVTIVVAILLVIAGIYFLKTNEASGENKNLEHPLTLTAVNLNDLKEAELPIIIDFGADECAPCKAMAPVLVKLNEEMQGKALIHFVDVWKNPKAATNFPVQLIPTQIFINADGTPYVPSKDLDIEFKAYGNKETGERIYTTHEGSLMEEQIRAILVDMGVKE